MSAANNPEASRSSPPAEPEPLVHDVEMVDTTCRSEPTPESPNPFWKSPRDPGPIPEDGSVHFKFSEPLSPHASLPEVASPQFFPHSLPLPPPHTMEPPEEVSPCVGAKVRTQRGRYLSHANRVGLAAFSEHFIADPKGSPPRAATTLDFPKGKDLKVEGITLVEELGPVLRSREAFITKTYTWPKTTDITQFIKTGAGGTPVETKAIRRKETKDDKTAKNGKGVKPAKETLYTGGVWDTKSNRWALPEKVALEKEGYTPMVDIISQIMDKWVACPPGVERKIVDTHDIAFLHKDEKYTSPDLVICACGPSFEKPEGAEYGYSNTATFIEMKREVDMGGPEAHIKQLALYARQIFAHQPNRIFIRCLLVSEKTFRLVHFDRSGAQVSERFNIHDKFPHFIRIIVALASPDERVLGFDTSIQWTTYPTTGRKTGGTLVYKTGTGPQSEKTYELAEKSPIAQHVIKGRATTCWAVQDPDTKETFVIKDSWLDAGRTPEHDHLMKATELEIEGVCQYISHAVGRCQTKDLRCKFSVNDPLFYNRISSRIMMKAHGIRIRDFKSILQLLMAFYDAISGHAQLSGLAKILHRDIHEGNILLGPKGAPVGWRGVLIDLGVAIDVYGLRKAIVREARTGSRFFQSCTILDFMTDLTDELAPAHTHLDDLEGFFYLLSRMFIEHEKNGDLRPDTHPVLKVIRGWDSEDADTALNSKCLFFNPGRRQKKIALDCIRESWGEPCAILFQKFHEWVGRVQVEKERIRGQYGPQDPEKESIYEPLLKQSASHYSQVLEFFDEAIIALGGPPAKLPRRPPGKPADGSQEGPGAVKRRRVEAEEELPFTLAPVRPRTRSHTVKERLC